MPLDLSFLLPNEHPDFDLDVVNKKTVCLK